MTHKFINGCTAHNTGIRNAAKKAGRPHYFTGKPCKNGHIANRATINGCCMECGRIKMAEFRKKITPEKKGEIDKLAAKRSAKWRAENKDHEGNRLAKEKYRINNRDKVNAATAKWAKNNRGKVMAYDAKRKADKIQRTPKWLTEDDHWMIAQAYDIAALRTKTLGFPWHVDHIIPLRGKRVSGLHVPLNLQVIPWVDNLSKSNRYEH